MAKAWSAQSKSLVEVQKKGTKLEATIRQLLGWESGKIVYEPAFDYKVQVDSVFPSTKKPQAVVSVTYTSPDTPGHSNENKLHLKVGELALLKKAYPKIRTVLAIGGAKESWLPYVLKAFRHFYDEVVYLWEPAGFERLRRIQANPLSTKLKNVSLWSSMKSELDRIKFISVNCKPPCGLVRYKILDILKAQTPIVHNPFLITNEVARLCMQRSFENNGAEWQSYLSGRWHNIEMSRNYFNPVEASVEISLESQKFQFKGGIARDVPVPSLLHELGMPSTSVSEDFVLYSEVLNMPVYIQCKSSGGGRDQHGKNIQNRTKEQITRSIIYRCGKNNDEIKWKKKKFHWIAILDGDWGVTKKEPLKYIHMLQLAGYDKIMSASDLLDTNCNVNRKGNPLIEYLTRYLNCTVET
jgi:hypothetical protein